MIRVIASAVRFDPALDDFLQNNKYLKRIIQIMDEFNDAELVINSAKVIRNVLKNDLVMDKVISQNVQLANVLCACMNKN